MKEIAPENRTPLLIDQLLELWEKSVRATHLFLSDDEMKEIKHYVPEALTAIPHLIIETDEKNFPTGFMGIADGKLEMLFIAPDARGKGLGKRLLTHGIQNYSVSELTVNEQNPQARGFYEHLGFEVYKKSELDEQGKPYPILYMKRDAV